MIAQRAQQRTQSVRDLLREALPIGTRVIAGQNALDRPVTWTSVLHTRAPAFTSLEGNELALLSIDALHLLSDKLTLADLIAELAGVDVAAIGVLGTIDSRARLIADDRQIPLLSLPAGSSLRQVERDVVKALVGPPPAAEARGQQIHEQLLQLSTENRGMGALVGAIADAVSRSVIVQDKRADVVASAGRLTDRDDWKQIEAALTDAEAIPAQFRNRTEVAQLQTDPVLIEMPEFKLYRLIVPIIANRMGRGFFSVLSEYPLEALDYQYTRHGAAVCALEMAKEKAVREAQKRVQGGILERLLLGTIPVEQALRQLVRLGHQPNNNIYAALSAQWAQDDSPSDRRLETIFNEQVTALGLDALVQLLEGGVVVFCAVDSPVGIKTLPRAIKQLTESVLSRIKSQFPNTMLTIGIGRAVANLAEWRTSYHEASASQRIAAQWHVYQPLFFADLGVYRLLSLLLETPELRSFYRETLGELADDRYANDDFITTLEAFFEEHGNLSQTATRLHVHRNTLLYRMERIEEIGKFDLDNPEMRLAVSLALKIRRLLNGK